MYDFLGGISPVFFFFLTQRAIYQSAFPYFVTTNTALRQWWFEDAGLAERLVSCIEFGCRIKGFDLLAYCILPDHVHLLVMKKSSRTLDGRTLERVRCGDENHSSSQSALSSARHPQNSVSDLMGSIKGTFSRATNLLSQNPENNNGIWQRRFNFRIVNTPERLRNTARYIQFNYRKMKLPEDPYAHPPYVFLDHELLKALL